MTSVRELSSSDGLAALASAYVRGEQSVLADCIEAAALSAADRRQISDDASLLVERIRNSTKRPNTVDALLQEYGLSTNEGIVLMRLSEALIRTPDASTARKLVRDKLSDADWDSHAGDSPSFAVNRATDGLRYSANWIKASGGADAENFAARLGDQLLVSAVEQAMGVMGKHFVLGRSIQEAADNARKSGPAFARQSYDMLGEAAHTAQDAGRYFDAYMRAARFLADNSNTDVPTKEAPSLSVKLSALHPRYEYAKADTCVPALYQRLKELALVAKSANFNLTIDAEEADRLETSLRVVELLLGDAELAGWDGLGIVVQAYQRRAMPLINWLASACRAAQRSISVRLVKGAYWDMEIKRAQELGLASYPVFTRKENTDVSYLACSRLLLDASDCIYPQFATHNAHTACAIRHMAGEGRRYEFQRLHGMGEALHTVLMDDFGASSRVYAPVGEHKDLLPYLVRRLLENGANSSFVNQLFDPAVTADTLAVDPVQTAQGNAIAANPRIPAPRDLFGGERQSAMGVDLTQNRTALEKQALLNNREHIHAWSIVDGEDIGETETRIFNPAKTGELVGLARTIGVKHINEAVASAAKSSWGSAFSPAERSKCLQDLADRLEADMDELIRICVLEAGKTLPDAVDEVREAVDFCRYYALQAQQPKMSDRKPLGVVACISPWNFPLAIFLGQIVAALSVGNTVVAKPAEQTPLIAHHAIKLLHDAGVPPDAVQLVLGDGAQLGTALTRNAGIDGICFTGSTDTAKRIAASLADTGRSAVPMIAETGGINAMIVDSTALLEQAVEDVAASAFQSAGQRCSACRLVCVQDDIAPEFEAMLAGAMRELVIGDPARLASDVGPVIDVGARAMIDRYVSGAKQRFELIEQVPETSASHEGHFAAPIALRVNAVADLEREIFGPVLHCLRVPAARMEKIVEDINGLGFGLTMGLHTRLDDRVTRIAETAKVGNLYVNRNQIGAVVGVQPFGGEGLSGTGPKAGGPHYLLRLTRNTETQAAASDGQSTLALDWSVPQSDTAKLLELSRQAAQKWVAGHSVEERRQQIADALTAGTAPQDSGWMPEQPAELLELPGPTGEDNTLTLHPRGVLLCFADGDIAVAKRQIARILSAGNGIVIAASPQDAATQTLIKLAAQQLPSGLMVEASIGEATQLLSHDIDGVVADGPISGEIAKVLRVKEGPILPLLSAYDEPPLYCHERTVTIDTTAAGGNASLLAMT